MSHSSQRISVDALVFDAYGTLFDVQSVAPLADALLPSRGVALAQLWRTKQLEYTWLQSLMRSQHFARDDFAGITARALDYALASLDVALDADARRRLCEAYRSLPPFADAAPMLAALMALRKLILSNGTAAMLRPLVDASGLAPHFEAVLSVDAADIYKPDPTVYRLATDHLGLPAERIGFVSANGWDAIGAKAFGFRSFWINRARAPLDRHGPAPDAVVHALTDLPALLAG